MGRRGDAEMGRRGEKERLPSESQLFPPIPVSSFSISPRVPVSPCPLVPVTCSLLIKIRQSCNRLQTRDRDRFDRKIQH
jgi:hypothetical protein